MTIGSKSEPKGNHFDNYFKLVVIFIEYFLFSSLSSRNSPFFLHILILFPIISPQKWFKTRDKCRGGYRLHLPQYSRNELSQMGKVSPFAVVSRGV